MCGDTWHLRSTDWLFLNEVALKTATMAVLQLVAKPIKLLSEAETAKKRNKTLGFIDLFIETPTLFVLLELKVCNIKKWSKWDEPKFQDAEHQKQVQVARELLNEGTREVANLSREDFLKSRWLSHSPTKEFKADPRDHNLLQFQEIPRQDVCVGARTRSRLLQVCA